MCLKEKPGQLSAHAWMQDSVLRLDWNDGLHFLKSQVLSNMEGKKWFVMDFSEFCPE